MDWLPAVDASFASHGLVFVGGLASGLSPCTLPTIALIVAYVGGYGKGHYRALSFSLAFVLGLSLTLAAIGFMTALAGGLLRDNSMMTLVAAGVCLLMGLGLVGVLPLPAWGTTPVSRARRGVVGAFLLGIPFAFAASPCTTPVTVAVLAYAATTGVPAWGATLLFCYALGRSIPLLVAGVLAGSATTLAVSDAWSGRLKTASGVVLLGVAVYLLWLAL